MYIIKSIEQIIEIKRLVQVVLEGEALSAFDKYKNALGFKNDSEVLRRAILFSEKRDRT